MPVAPGRKGRFLDRALLNVRDPAGDADDHAWVREPVPVCPPDEVAEHRLGHLEVGDDAVSERADRTDRRGRSPDHALGLGTDGVDVARGVVDSDNGRLEEDDAFTPDIDDRVGGPEVNRHVAVSETAQVVQQSHRSGRP